jgi:hypothetical protein
MKKTGNRNYTLKADDVFREFPAPKLPSQPRMPKQYRPKIGLIGCGGVTSYHLDAYRAAGGEVAALWRDGGDLRYRFTRHHPGLRGDLRRE